MQPVSEVWKENQKQTFTEEGFVELAITVTDPDAQAAALASDNGHSVYSNTESVVSEVENAPQRYATLERNLWLLDGSFKILPSGAPPESNGYIGEVLSGDDGAFANPPVITIAFPQVFSTLLQGITITWGAAYDDEVARDFTVTAYNGSATVASKAVTDNTELDCAVFLDMQNYDRITIEISKWSLPHHRPRIKSVLIGIRHVFDKADLFKYQHTMEVDLLSASLPKTEIQFDVQNLDGLYDPNNPSGMTKYLMERQPVVAKYGYKLGGQVEWIKAGTFFLSEWQTPRNGISATFTARDMLEYMSDLYTGPASGTLKEIALAALDQAALPLTQAGTVSWILDETLQGISAPDGVDLSAFTIAEVLQLVANAGCCGLWQDRDGVLHIEPIGDVLEADYAIVGNTEYSHPETTLSKQLKAVDINRGEFVLTVGEVGETQPVVNPLIGTAQAENVAVWVAGILQKRQSLDGNIRIDPRLDYLDTVMVETPFADNKTIITGIQIDFNGGFTGTFTGRVVDS